MNWPPVLDEMLLNVFINAKKEASHRKDVQTLRYWNQAREEVNNFIREKFPHLPERDIAALGDKLNFLRRPTTVSNISI